MLVVTNLSEDLILRHKLQTQHKFCIDFNSKRLFSSQFSTDLICCKAATYRVIVEQDSVIKQMSVIPCKIVNEKGQTPCINFKGNYWGDESLGYASGKETVNCTVENGAMDICFANLCTNATVKIPKGATVGWIRYDKECVEAVKTRKWEDKDPTRIEFIIKALGIEDNENLVFRDKQVVKDLVKKFSDIFATGRHEINETNLVQHEIPLITDKPINVPYRRVPFHLVDDCEKEIKELLDAGIIEHSDRNYNSPLIILKKGEKTRLIIDFRELNKYSQRSQAAVPALFTLTVGWHGCKYFSSLDIKDGFLQIPINPAHRKYTTFAVIELGFYQFRRMPLGLCGAPSTFQNLLDRLLAGLKTKAAAYIDGIILGARTLEEIINNLRQVFTRIRTSKLRFNPSKCELLKKRVKCLGMYLSEEGIEPDREKIKAIQNMSIPKTKKQMMRFIGGTSWFRNHIPNLSEITKPLSDTFRGQRFNMKSEALKAVENAKKVLTEAPILIFADKDKEMLLHTDASEQAMGRVIGHKINHKFFPMAYGSRILNDTEQKYPSFKREFMAIKHFILFWRHYLINKRFLVVTDMKAITYESFMKKTNSTTILRWILELAGFEFRIKHKAGKEMELPDMLSRLPSTSDKLYDWWIKVTNKARGNSEDSTKITAVAVWPQGNNSASGDFDNPLPAINTQVTGMSKAQKEDSKLRIIREWVKKGEKPPKSDLVPIDWDTLVYWQSIGKRFYHDADTSGHMGHKQTLHRVKQHFFNPNMSTEIKLYCASCPVCFKINLKFQRKPFPPLRPFPPSRPNEFVVIDLVEPLSKTGYYKWIFTMVCRFTKLVVAIPLRNATSPEIAKGFVNYWVLKFGVPEKVLSDRGANLIQSELMKEVYAVLGIKKVNTTAYKPQGNGKVERMIRSLVTVLKKLVYDNPTNWAKKLACAVFAVNSSINSSTGFTPNLLFLGRECRSPQDLVFSTTNTEFYRNQAHLASDLNYQMKETFDLVRVNMQVSQNMQKNQYDKKAHFHTNYKIGDKVLVWKPINQSIVDYRKFREAFSGPWEIVKVLSPWNYSVKHETTAKEEAVHFNKMRLIPSAVIASQERRSLHKDRRPQEPNKTSHLKPSEDMQETMLQIPYFENYSPAAAERGPMENLNTRDRQYRYNLRSNIQRPIRYQS